MEQLLVVVAVCAWFRRMRRVREDVACAVGDRHEGTDHLPKLARDRNPADRRRCLRRTDDHLRVLPPVLHDVDALQRLRDVDHPRRKIDVLPFQRTDLADPQARTEADVDPQVHMRRMRMHIFHDPLLPAAAQHRDFRLLPLRRETHIDLPMRHMSVLHGIPPDHHQHDQNVLHRLPAQSRIQLPQHKLLHHLLRHIHLLPEGRLQMVHHHQRINRVCGPLDIQFLVIQPQRGNLIKVLLFHSVFMLL